LLGSLGPSHLRTFDWCLDGFRGHRDPVTKKRHLGKPLHRHNEVIGDLFGDDDATAPSFAEVPIEPTHVVQKLAYGSVSTLGELEFDDNRSPTRVEGKDVDPTTVNRELHASSFALPIQLKSRLKDIEIVGEVVTEVSL
jgi:hypothetical protein